MATGLNTEFPMYVGINRSGVIHSTLFFRVPHVRGD